MAVVGGIRLTGPSDTCNGEETGSRLEAVKRDVVHKLTSVSRKQIELEYVCLFLNSKRAQNGVQPVACVMLAG